VVAICNSVTNDAAALGAVCAAVGVAETARILCDDVGYDAATCASVAEQAATLFSSCAEVTYHEIVDGVQGPPMAHNLCPALQTMEEETDCAVWGAADGPRLGMGSSAILALQAVVPNGVTTADWCQSLPVDADTLALAADGTATNNLGAQANVAACMSIAPDALGNACAFNTVGAATEADAVSETVRLLCLDLGFPEASCADVTALLAPQGVTSCAVLVAAQPTLCAQTAGLTDAAEDCVTWAGHGYIPGTVDMGAFNSAVASLSTTALETMTIACQGVASHNIVTSSSATCRDHPLGHICATLADNKVCEHQADVAVAEAFCQSAGSPQASVVAICNSVTNDAAALGAVCAAVGVAETARILCDDVGYSGATCASVAEQAATLFSSCAEVTYQEIVDGVQGPPMAQNLCPALQTMEEETDCAVWGSIDGPALAMGSSAILALRAAVPNGVTTVDWCQSLPVDADTLAYDAAGTATNNLGAQANVAACLSVDPVALHTVCMEYKDEAQGAVAALNIECLNLGFEQDSCDQAAALLVNASVVTCVGLIAAQSAVCPSFAALTDPAEDCVTWGAHGFLPVSVDQAAYNTAVNALSTAAKAQLNTACAAVEDGTLVTSSSATCRNHPFGHICATHPTCVSVGRLTCERDQVNSAETKECSSFTCTVADCCEDPAAAGR
jgi:hypothetical protein